MVRKGRFKILSYFIEDFLVFYKSMNKKKKFIAFSMLKTSDLSQSIVILNDFLKRNFLYYYSIQYSLSEKEEKFFLLCFKDVKKSNIIKFYNFIREKIIKTNGSAHFLSKKELENTYLDVIERIRDPNIKIWKKNNRIFLKNENEIRILEFYDLNLKNDKKEESPIYFLFNFFRDFNKEGFFIFNFKSNDIYEIILSAYYVDIIKSEDEKHSNLNYEVNRFFDYEILRKHIPCINDLANLIWRFNISRDYYVYKNFNKLFNIEKKTQVRDLLKFNLQFEKLLNQNKIEFQRLSPNLLLIEQRVLFLTLLTLDFQFILRLSKNFYLKYKIYILFLDEEEYQKVINVEKVKELENLKILNYEDYLKFNLENFKKSLLLENT